MHVKTIAAALTLAATTLLPGISAAADYPQHPVKIVVPFLAGGAIDVMGRLLAQNLADRTGQPFIVDNRAGAGGTIGAAVVAKAEPDGYTLLFTAQGPLVINPFLYEKMPYDAQTAFTPITVVAEAPNVLATYPGAPVDSLQKFIDYGRGKHNPLTFATQGVGTTGHVTSFMMAKDMNVALSHVPYKGFSPMFTDVVAGRVDLMITDTFNIVPRVQQKELVPLAVAARQRFPALPDVPTFAEAGYPEVVAGPWFSLVGPAGMPEEIRSRLAEQVGAALREPAVAKRLQELGAQIVAMPPQEFDTFLKSEYQRWGDAVRAGGLTKVN